MNLLLSSAIILCLVPNLHLGKVFVTFPIECRHPDWQSEDGGTVDIFPSGFTRSMKYRWGSPTYRFLVAKVFSWDKFKIQIARHFLSVRPSVSAVLSSSGRHARFHCRDRPGHSKRLQYQHITPLLYLWSLSHLCCWNILYCSDFAEGTSGDC